METILINLAFLVLYIIIGFFIYRNLNKNNYSEFKDQSKDTEFEASIDSQQVRFAEHVCPYEIFIKNPTDRDLTCVLFGCDDFLLSENFGSDKEIQVTPAFSVRYSKLLLQSAFKPFETGLIKMHCSNKEQFKQKIDTISGDANGQACFIPVHTEAYIPPLEEQENWRGDIIEMPYSTTVDCSTYWKIKVLANTGFTLIIYPKKKLNWTSLLYQKEPLTKYVSPQSQSDSPKIVKN